MFSHAGEDPGVGGPVGHCAAPTAGIDAAILRVEPRVELPVAERHPDLVMVRLHLGQHCLVRGAVASFAAGLARGVVVVSTVVSPAYRSRRR